MTCLTNGDGYVGNMRVVHMIFQRCPHGVFDQFTEDIAEWLFQVGKMSVKVPIDGDAGGSSIAMFTDPLSVFGPLLHLFHHRKNVLHYCIGT